MMKFDPAKKVQLIKEIKGLIEGMNLVQVSYTCWDNLENTFNDEKLLPVRYGG